MRRLVLLSLIAVAGCAQPESREVRFAYQGGLAADKWLHLRTTNGNIALLQSPDGRVAIQAVGTGNTRDLRFVIDSANGDLTVCAVRGSARCGREQSHDSRGLVGLVMHLLMGGTQDAKVAYTVWLPAEARAEVATVNGGVRLESRAREIRANTVNGSIKGTAVSERFAGETVNGSIHVQLGIVGDAPQLQLQTVNGSVTAELPASFAGHFALKTVNGKAVTDFPYAGAGDVVGGARPKSLSGAVGSGAANISIESVNGSVTLHRLDQIATNGNVDDQ